MENLKPEISQLISNAIYSENLGLLKDLYEIKPYVTESWEIIYSPEVEIMERVVRTLARLDLTQKILSGKFTVLGCPKEKRKDMRWFISLFALIESECSNWELAEGEVDYPVNKFHREIFSDARMAVDVDISELKFLYRKVSVGFKSLKVVD